MLTVGKYVFVGLIYLLIFAIFRLLIAQTRTKAATPWRGGREPTPARQTPDRLLSRQPVEVTGATSQPAPDRQSQLARLVVVSTSASSLSSGLSFPLGKSTSIGRKSHNDITMQDRYVSATHALIIDQEGKHILRDYHSTNGTLLNNVNIKQDVVLSDGDEITVGTTVFRYQA